MTTQEAREDMMDYARVLVFVTTVLVMAAIRDAVAGEWGWMILNGTTVFVSGMAATTALWTKDA